MTSMSREPKDVFDAAPDDLRREILGVVWLAVHDACRREGTAPDGLPTDLGFTLAVVERMFEDVEVARAWRAARGPDWLQGDG